MEKWDIHMGCTVHTPKTDRESRLPMQTCIDLLNLNYNFQLSKRRSSGLKYCNQFRTKENL